MSGYFNDDDDLPRQNHSTIPRPASDLQHHCEHGRQSVVSPQTDAGGRNSVGGDKKPTNPKDAVGVRKNAYSVMPPRVLAECGLAMMEGALKYAPYNWRRAGVRGSIYYDAALGHIMRWWEGEDIDRESSLSHITKAICSLIVLRDGMMEGNWVDDRPKASTAEQIDLMRNHPLVGELIDRYTKGEEE